ncbi:MAG: galactose-1-phosphate uridylyltransferase [Gemmataceae bacterium]
MIPTVDVRTCPLRGLPVLFAPERSARPGAEATVPEPPTLASECPFCPGHEEETPEARVQWPDRPTEPWQIRIVPNRFPAIPHGIPGSGHEVFIEGRDHQPTPAGFSGILAVALWEQYQARVCYYADQPGVRHVALFKNVGTAAGASLWHAHSQLLATPFVPPAVQAEVAAAEQFYQSQGQSYWAKLRQRNTVAERGRYLLVVPEVPRFSGEVWIVPREPEADFRRATDLPSLAALVQWVLREGNWPAFNWCVQMPPIEALERPGLEWCLQILPRTSQPAGYEWATGMTINTIPPEASIVEWRSRFRRWVSGDSS